MHYFHVAGQRHAWTQQTCAALWLLCCWVSAGWAQATAFSYQGKLTDGGTQASGNFDLQFKLFDTVTLGSGTQQGTTVTISNVVVTAGVFTVQLDFGACAGCFNGAARFLEIAVKPTSSGTFTVLGPRQPITSTPYALKSANAAAADILSPACVGCVGSAQIGSLPTNSGNYIQNTAILQASSNFNISGNGFIGGKLGIGTTAPAHALQINGTTLLGAPGGVYGFSIAGAAPGPYPSLGFNAFYDAINSRYVAGVTGYGGIFQFQDGDGKFGFYSTSGSVAAGVTHTFVPRLTILPDGKVGIGTTTPTELLQVQGSSGNYGTLGSIGAGVAGHSSSEIGVYGNSYSGEGVLGFSYNNYAGYFDGKARVTGVIEKAGGGFKIDHPLDPANKYLVHSFVESPDMKNLYDGTVTTDAQGEAEITLPDWFAALNRDFRYQLTCIGVFAQAIIAEEIKDNRFKIRTSLPQVKVSWQVTGTRQDAWANQNRLPVEEAKPEVERGFYQNPSAFSQPEERSLIWARHPEMMKQQKEQHERSLHEQSNKDVAPYARPNNR